MTTKKENKMKKKDVPARAARRASPKYTYVLRSCAADLSSSRGFVWPAKGKVSAPDWKQTKECGNGLHGFLMGVGDHSLANWSPDAKWLVVKVEADTLIDLNGKVKFPAGEVVYCGDRMGAAAFIIDKGGDPAKVIGGTATAGDGGTATAGDRGTATAGYGGTATAGDGGTATAGYGGTATAGDRGTIVFSYWDDKAERKRVTIGYIGEDGLVPGKKYRLQNGKIVKAQP